MKQSSSLRFLLSMLFPGAVKEETFDLVFQWSSTKRNRSKGYKMTHCTFFKRVCRSAQFPNFQVFWNCWDEQVKNADEHIYSGYSKFQREQKFHNSKDCGLSCVHPPKFYVRFDRILNLRLKRHMVGVNHLQNLQRKRNTFVTLTRDVVLPIIAKYVLEVVHR